MRHLLRSLAALSALAVCGSLAAHAAPVQYTGTATLTDLTTAGNVSATFLPISFQDPPTGTIFTPFDDQFNLLAKPGSDGDELQISIDFTAPGTGSGTLSGDMNITGRRNQNGDISWDSAFSSFGLDNGSFLVAALPNFLGIPLDLHLNQCGSNFCASNADLYIYVTDNDPALSATPEPSSLALLGTGVLGLAGMVRRKLAV